MMSMMVAVVHGADTAAASGEMTGTRAASAQPAAWDPVHGDNGLGAS